jgi:hypothetical protein
VFSVVVEVAAEQRALAEVRIMATVRDPTTWAAKRVVRAMGLWQCGFFCD